MESKVVNLGGITFVRVTLVNHLSNYFNKKFDEDKDSKIKRGRFIRSVNKLTWYFIHLQM